MVKAVYFVLLLAIILNVTIGQHLEKLPEEFLTKANTDREKCLKQHSSVNENTINALRKKDWSKVDNDENAKCFILCYLQQNQDVYKDGEITDYYMKFIEAFVNDDTDYNQLQENCKDKRRFNDCKGAYEAFKCFAKYRATVL